MGNVYHSIPRELALYLKKTFDLNTFVETGTFRGDATAWASKNFSKIITMEVFENYIIGAKKTTCAGLDNIEFVQGRSDEVLAGVIFRVSEPSLIWLDAHWGGDLHYGKPEVECPLMSELSAIKNLSKARHILMIDDARLFLSTPPEPLSPNKWPKIEQIVNLLGEMRYYALIIDDVIVALPRGSFGFK